MSSILISGFVLVNGTVPAEALTLVETLAHGTVTDGFRPLYREGGTLNSTGDTTLADGGPYGINAGAHAMSGEATASTSISQLPGSVGYTSSASAQAGWSESFLVAGPDGEKGQVTVNYSLTGAVGNVASNFNYIVRARSNFSFPRAIGDEFFGAMYDTGSLNLSGNVIYEFDYNRPFSIDGTVQSFSQLRDDSDVTSTQANVTLRFTTSLTPVAPPPPPPPPVGPEIVYAGPSLAVGLFNEATNWNPQQVPQKNDTRSDIAIFSRGDVYSVDVGTASTERALFNGGPAAVVTFTNANYTIAGTNPDDPGLAIDGGKLTLQSGTIHAIHAIIGKSAASEMEVSSDLFGGVGRLNVTGSLQVGGAGEGKFNISLGGQVTSGESRIGGNGGDARVIGAGSVWNTGNIAVGYFGSGQLTASDGAHLNSQDAAIGGLAESASVLITGEGTIWETRDLTVGRVSQGILNVTEKALVKSRDMVVGDSGEGTLLLDTRAQLQARNLVIDNGSSINVKNEAGISISNESAIGADIEIVHGRLTIESGGQVMSMATAETIVGRLGVGPSSVIVRGVGTPLTAYDTGQSSFGGTIGSYSTLSLAGSAANPAKLTVEDGGVAGFNRIYIGVLEGQAEAVIVGLNEGSGYRSTLHAYDGLDVGNSRAGTTSNPDPIEIAAVHGFLDIRGGAVVEVGIDNPALSLTTLADAFIGIGPNAVGSVLVREYGGGMKSLLNVTRDLSVGSDSGNGTLSIYDADVRVGRNLFVGFVGFSFGAVDMVEGTLVIQDDVFVGETSRIRGTGELFADDIINFGSVSPGLSPGLLTFNANYTSGMTSLLEMEIAGLLPGLEHDQIIIDGDAFLAGKLRISFINGFQPAEGDSFRLLDIRGITSGQFDQVEVIGLAGGLAAVYNPRTGRIELSAATLQPVPEPATVLLWNLALVGLARRRCRRM